MFLPSQRVDSFDDFTGTIDIVFHAHALSGYSQIFSAIISLGAAQPGLSNPESTRYELWIAFIEQGLVGIVETISSGAPILNSSDRFPEQPLRIQAQSIFLMMANDLCQPQNLHLIERLIATMHHSSNEQLFRNTLLGMLFLSARREALARLVLHLLL